MSAIVTDQFRILNTNNFIESAENDSNSYYIFLGLPNPTQVGFGRSTTWNTNVPNPTDNLNYQSHVYDTMLFGKKVTSANIKRIVRRIDWVKGTRYEMYRHDYSVNNPSPTTQSSRLYDANYYVMNSDYRVYICVDNGASGINTTGNASQDEPTFTDLEPSKAGSSGDGYVWKYLFSVSPSDIIKFDSTEYITVPSNWQNSTDAQIQAVRENGDSTVNENQIKKVYIDNLGANYSNGLGQELNILGDGSGAKVIVDVVSGKITNTTVSSGGKGYSYGVVDLGSINSNSTGSFARLIPIIPPSKGHGYDIYKELGADKILLYARFDDSSKDFPIDTKFAQVGIVKNPTSLGSTSVYTQSQFSSLYSVKFSSVSGTPTVGEKISQSVTNGKAVGYVASYDTETKVLKYIQDRSLYFNQTTLDQTDYVGVSTGAKVLSFESSSNAVTGTGGFSGSIDQNFTGISTNPTGTKVINLGVNFTNGLASPEINKGSGDIIYLDNRPLISRNSRQKEDIKIILEF
jgi:Bacteriophage T4, Gp8